AHSRSKNRSTLSRKPQEAPTADQILNRIKAVTGELEALQAEIYYQVNQGARQTPSGAERSSNARLLGEFKRTLDRLRQVLSFYLERVPPHPAANKALPPEPVPLHRTLYPQAKPSHAPGMPTGSFFDRLDVVIDAYMKNAATRGEASPRKRAK